MSAHFSKCNQYRYWLSRPSEVMLPERSTALFIMLNPSTADATKDDQTIRRCRGFAERWGCDGLIVANLYALKATYPKDLWLHNDPVGPDNDKWLQKLVTKHRDIVCAWGNDAKSDRVNQFCELTRKLGVTLWCLGTTKSGAPRHPSRLRNDQQLIRWSPN